MQLQIKNSKKTKKNWTDSHFLPADRQVNNKHFEIPQNETIQELFVVFQEKDSDILRSRYL